jgi:adenylate cyclase
MIYKFFRNHASTIVFYFVVTVIFALVYTTIEYFNDLNSDDPQLFLPLLIRGISNGMLIGISIAFFDIFSPRIFVNKRFLFVVLVRASVYTFSIILWLSLTNGVWNMILNQITFIDGMLSYLSSVSFRLNLIIIFAFVIIIHGFTQINSLHRKHELFNFIIGRFHEPIEVKRIFCFIDLAGSTTIAENLGHYKFGLFLKDYYGDITPALRKTQAEIYQYVGDEIVLSWPYEKGIKNNNAIRCYFLMKDIMSRLQSKYEKKYGYCPKFRAGTHGGNVTVTWVGEIKKEILFLGDVLNTTSRIQEASKRLSKDFLISEELLHDFEKFDDFTASFEEETKPRGKDKKVRMYSVDTMA